ncbi:MAG: hypothetical protein AAF990_03570 [Bacteroidota bacterium]
MSTEKDMPYERKVDEISLRDLVLKVQDYLRLPLQYWYLMILAALPLSIYNYITYSKIKPTFGVRISFFVKTRQNMKDNALTAQIFARYAASGSAVEATLRTKVKIDGNFDYMINHYLQSFYSFKPEEINPTIPQGFQFEHLKIDSFNTQELMVYNSIVRKTATTKRDFSDGFVSSSIDKKLGFITINFSSPSENLSLAFIETLQTVMQEQYINNTLYAKKEAVDHLRMKSDSLKVEFDLLFNKLLRYKDKYAQMKEKEELGSHSRSLSRRIQRLEINVALLKEQYLDATEKLKAVEIDMYNSTPIIHIAEKTLPQMAPYQPSVILATIKGAILGCAIILFLLLFRKIYLDILAEKPSTPFQHPA